MDVLSSAYEMAKDGVMRLKAKISGAALEAMAKVNELFQSLVSRAFDVASKAPEKAVAFCSSVLDRVQAFQQKHPVLFKVVTILVLTALAFAIMSFFDKEAAASVTRKGAKIDQETYQQMRGALVQNLEKVMQQKDASGFPDMTKAMNMSKIIQQFDDAAKSTADVDIESLKGATGSFVNRAYDVVTKITSDAAKGNSQAADILKTWGTLGKNAVIQSTGG